MGNTRTFDFPDIVHRDRFMKIFDHYTGWGMENHNEGVENQRGRLLVHQSFGKPIYMNWEISGCRVTFDETLLRVHYQGNVDFHVWNKINEYAERFDAGRAPSRVGLGSVKIM